jgi:hypothetical protein
VREKMELVLVDSADEALRHALRLPNPESFLRAVSRVEGTAAPTPAPSPPPA